MKIISLMQNSDVEFCFELKKIMVLRRGDHFLGRPKEYNSIVIFFFFFKKKGIVLRSCNYIH